jgi:hypothetical protein
MARDAALLTQVEFPVRVAILPSSVWAIFSVTRGRTRTVVITDRSSFVRGPVDKSPDKDVDNGPFWMDESGCRTRTRGNAILTGMTRPKAGPATSTGAAPVCNASDRV